MKRSRLIAILLTAMMVLSAAATGVFALDEINTTEPAANAGTGVEQDAPDTLTPDNGDGTFTVDGDVTSAPASAEGSDEDAQQTRDIPTAFTDDPDINENVITVRWDASDENAAKVSRVVVKNNGVEVEGVDFTVSADEKFGKKKTFKLDYEKTYTFELWLEDATEPADSKDWTTLKKSIPAPGAFSLNAYPAYHSVYLAWTPSSDATRYVLYRTDGEVFDVGTATSYSDANNAADTTYSYYVVASNDTGSAQSNVASAARVRTCYYRITFKKAVKLTSHDGTKTKHTFQKGQVVYADGFAQGMYQFDFEGHRYHAKWMRIKSPSGDYARNAYENGVTPTLYVNQTQASSPTGYLIWISLYSQRVYVFQGSAGNWTLVQNWQCGSGKAKTPTPTGMNKSLHKKMKKYSKHKWWNCFSGNNAIHGSNGQKEIKKLGKLISNGCVRVTNEQAIWIFNTVPKGTRVLVF